MSRERSKKQKRAGQGGAVPSLNCIEPNAAGIDVGATEIFVAVPQDRALRLAAQTLERSTSYLGIFYRKMCARLGRPAGITATAHKLARIIFHMVTTGRAYDESIFAAEEQRQRKHFWKAASGARPLSWDTN